MSGCSSCGTSSDGSVKVSGCKNNGNCSTGGCNKLNSFDWLVDMEDVGPKFSIIEVRFKNGRKEFFKNVNNIEMYNGDPVIVDVPNGHHLGHVALQGELVRLQMQKKNVLDDENIRPVYRLATKRDLEKYEEVKSKEMTTLYRTREILRELGLVMKLTDVEYQSDGTKATFYYSADDRVDFRELIKTLAGEFRVRIEMRQISLRQEASRLGGIGSCGRELCCSTWLTEFKSVSTTAARYQNLSLNPGKLSGQCGRLKCCLNYELETYMSALEDIPQVEVPLLTMKGEATLQKTDIFRKILWFGYKNENTWVPVGADRVREILEQNQKGNKPATLIEDSLEIQDDTQQVLNSDLERMDRKFKNKSKKKKGRKNFQRNKGNIKKDKP
ncbi:MAG: stage 0 sporulation family protein [Cyclobacteriaceae bacterium]